MGAFFVRLIFGVVFRSCPTIKHSIETNVNMLAMGEALVVDLQANATFCAPMFAIAEPLFHKFAAPLELLCRQLGAHAQSVRTLCVRRNASQFRFTSFSTPARSLY